MSHQSHQQGRRDGTREAAVGEQFMNRPWKDNDKTSYATLRQGPGPGVTFDPKKMADVAKNTKRNFR